MKRLTLNTLAIAMLAATSAHASSQFAGPYFGINLGQNTSSQIAGRQEGNLSGRQTGL